VIASSRPRARAASPRSIERPRRPRSIDVGPPPRSTRKFASRPSARRVDARALFRADRPRPPPASLSSLARSRRVASPRQEFPKRDAALAAGKKDKVVAKAFKEGGKKGVEIEGAADTSGLTCFCTRMQNSAGDIILLEAAMEGMNAVPDPEDPEERKGCSGHISKLIISENEPEKKIAMVAYVTEEHKEKINAIEWMKSVCETDLGGGVGGTPDDASTDTWATCTAVEDTDKGFFYLKMKDNTLAAAIQYLRERGLFNDEEDDEDEENPAADFEW